jgi:hypothetical protein
MGLPFYLVYAWALLGVVALLLQAVVRLAPIAWEPIALGMLSTTEATVYVSWVLFNAYAEGYRAFQKAFCPRVVARAHHVAVHPSALHALLAPAFAMCLLHATRRRLIVSWCLVCGLFLLVLAVRSLPQPWRGIVDGGVVVGLGWGLLALVAGGLRALKAGPPAVTLHLPEQPRVASSTLDAPPSP